MSATTIAELISMAEATEAHASDLAGSLRHLAYHQHDPRTANALLLMAESADTKVRELGEIGHTLSRLI